MAKLSRKERVRRQLIKEKELNRIRTKEKRAAALKERQELAEANPTPRLLKHRVIRARNIKQFLRGKLAIRLGLRYGLTDAYGRPTQQGQAFIKQVVEIELNKVRESLKESEATNG